MTTPVPGLPGILRLTDPARRAARAAELLERLQAEHAQREEAVMAARDQACRELLGEGATYAGVARVIGRTRAGVAKRFPEFAPPPAKKKKRGD